MKKYAFKAFIAAALAACAALFGGCQSTADENSAPKQSEQSTQAATETNHAESKESTGVDETETNKLRIQIGDNSLFAVPEDNASARALIELLKEKPLTIPASNYGGFEKVCELGTRLPTNDVQTTARAGDICLYNGNKIVIFYGSNSWSYTRLGKISGADSAELERILSGTDAEITLSLDR